MNPRPEIDQELLAQLDRILHPDVGNLLTAMTVYFVAHDCFLRSGDAKWLNRFQEADDQIRAFVESHTATTKPTKEIQSKRDDA